MELTALADMLGLHSLLDLVCSTMITRVCHNFHKVSVKHAYFNNRFKYESFIYIFLCALLQPCKDCIVGVLTSYQMATTYNLISLQSKCLQWITKYMTKTWNSRGFANLPEPLQLNCLESTKKSMVCLLKNDFYCLQL